MLDVGIIGAGAAGLACAARLRELMGDEITVHILEARDRIGGRILTVTSEGTHVHMDNNIDRPVLEFGAQWAHNYQGTECQISAKDFVNSSKTGLKVSTPESWIMTEDALILYKRSFPDVTEFELSQLSTWLEGVIGHSTLKWELICKEEGFDLSQTSAQDVLNYSLRPDVIQAWIDNENSTRSGSGSRNKNSSSVQQTQIQMPSPAAIALGREFQRNMFSNYFGMEAQHTSYESLDDVEDEQEHRVVTNGYVRALQHLRDQAGESLTVHLNRKVTHVSQNAADGSGVTVTWTASSGEKEVEEGEREIQRIHFDYLVCTVPLGVLKTGQPHFSPALPDAIAASISRLGVGLLHKTYLLWEESDWPKVTVPARIIYPTDHCNTFAFVLNLGDERYHGPGLFGYCAYACYPWAAQAELLGTEELTDKFMSVLEEALDDGSEVVIPRPKNVLVSSWLHDPLSLGAYSAQRVGSPMSDFDAFSTTDYGRVFFAGEHAQSEMYGCVQAAMNTGYIAAGKISSLLLQDDDHTS
jgi:monoamine oxidase